MNKNKLLTVKTVAKVMDRTITRDEAARILGVSLRTIHNYVKKYSLCGPEGLRDQRRGHFRKIDADEEIRIVACKLDNPRRSARWIRHRLKLPVSAEAVRRVLLKHYLNQNNLGPRSSLSLLPAKWDPF